MIRIELKRHYLEFHRGPYDVVVSIFSKNNDLGYRCSGTKALRHITRLTPEIKLSNEVITVCDYCNISGYHNIINYMLTKDNDVLE